MTLEIRIAGATDASAVRQVLAASYPVLMADAYDDALLARALPLMTQANPRLLGSGTYYLAELGGSRWAAAAGLTRSQGPACLCQGSRTSDTSALSSNSRGAESDELSTTAAPRTRESPACSASTATPA